MKVLLANKFFFQKGGAECIFFDTAKLLESKGHEVEVFSMKHPSNLPSKNIEYFISNINYEHDRIGHKIRNSVKLLYSFDAKKKIEKLLKDTKPDIAHLHNIYHQISPSILHSLKKHNLPVIMTLHDYKLVCASYLMISNGMICEACHNGKYYNCFLKHCVKDSSLKSLLNTVEMYLHHKIFQIYNLVDVFISPSRFLMEKVNEMGFKGDIEYLPNFVPPESFDPGYKAKTKEKSICYIGRLSIEKGIETLIRSVKGLNIKLKVIGDGPMMDDLKALKENENVHNVEFLGYRVGNDLKNEIKHSMALVIPSDCNENNPRSVIESFALGTPVVGARIGGIPELVKDNQTGYTFESGNVSDLRAKISQLLDNPSEIRRMGQNAQAFVEQKLNAEKHYEGLMDIYNMAIEKNRQLCRK